MLYSFINSLSEVSRSAYSLLIYSLIQQRPLNYTLIAFLIHKRCIPDPEKLNQQSFKCAAQMRELLYLNLCSKLTQQ
ncbi:MAG: hypothetical protein DWQ54_25830 [Microcystis flos-aquae TF09]|uniref:Uncharacterized protein n=1 Tax=Microcystis flos-aquae TF09 TaxID=2060473 RepID=A0A3E0KTI9_9CHRO|nr:MAG: hypothetical protein DWQ54_25830 [Microcystis flos-aquae TF09]